MPGAGQCGARLCSWARGSLRLCPPLRAAPSRRSQPWAGRQRPRLPRAHGSRAPARGSSVAGAQPSPLRPWAKEGHPETPGARASPRAALGAPGGAPLSRLSLETRAGAGGCGPRGRVAARRKGRRSRGSWRSSLAQGGRQLCPRPVAGVWLRASVWKPGGDRGWGRGHRRWGLGRQEFPGDCGSDGSPRS